MINISEGLETNRMILEENLDVRTITMGISLLDCADRSLEATCDKIYAKLMRLAKNLVKTGDEIGREFGIPIVNKRISITPAAIVGAACCKKKSFPIFNIYLKSEGKHVVAKFFIGHNFSVPSQKKRHNGLLGRLT
jgi:uncharacterized protein (UPF0210 family)